MSWKDIISLCLGILGVITFLYGSNYYNAVAGWGGIVLIVSSIALEIALKVYGFMRKRGERLEAV
jgi:hypothetical protein